MSRIDNEQLHIAAQDGDTHRVRKLIDGGCDPNNFDEISNTPLTYAALYEHLDVMKVLIDAGAEVNIYDKRKVGNTVLREVVESCSYMVARLLIESGADPTIADEQQVTALQKAKERNGDQGQRVYSLLLEASQKN